MTARLNEIQSEALHKAFREALATEGGIRLVYWMLEQCAMYESAFTGEQASTNFILGKQEVGRRVVGKLDEIDPEFYPQLLLHIAEIRAVDRSAADAQTNPEDDEYEAP